MNHPVSEIDLLDWWQSPMGCEVRQELRARILQLNDEALSEPVISNTIKSAIFLGKKQAFQEMLDWGESKEIK